MYRRGLWCLLALAVAACQGDQATRPSIGDPPPPSSAISDGAHSNGNPDFWFLPPMVPNPEGNPKYLDNGFNPNLTPEVEITAGATVILPRTPASLNGDHYHLNWKVPSSPTTLYRVTVWVGSSDIGFADLWTSANNAELKNVNTNEYVPLKDGRTLPIKFVIEKYALCRVPGEGPCASEVVSLAAGGTVEVTLPGTSTASGVSIPPQGSGPAPVITIEPCEDEGGPYDLNPRVTDLPVYGPCLTIISDPPTADLANAATVFVCDITPFLPTTMSAAQRERLTLLRSDPGAVTALPHTEHVCAPEVGAVGSLRGVLADLGDGRFRSAGRQLLAMLAPKPLYAALMLDVGAGGFTDEFSDFQFALPAKMAVVASTDNQSALAGSTLPIDPQVLVTDLGGEPVEKARVRFADTQAGCEALPAGNGTETDASGNASTSWTLSSTHGANALFACGRGIAGTTVNGPRTSGPNAFDPFQPIQEHFDGLPLPSGATGGVNLATGWVAFSATGQGDFEAGDPTGWTATGFWHRSTLLSAPATPIVNNAFVDGLVALAAGDGSGGALPSPFAGSYVHWYGVEADGNYIGTRANSTPGSGGTSTAANSGTLSTSSFVVPTGRSLHFASWFEIESVDAHAFDLMSVSIEEVGGPTTLLGRLNPTSDLNGSQVTPFTSGGFNAPPIWVTIQHDLSTYAGKTVRLHFSFNTGDALYNGFRGWLLDNLRLQANTSFGGGGSMALSAATEVQGLNPPQPATGRSPK